MGKKDKSGIKRKRIEDEDLSDNEENEIDPEYEAEMNAVLAIRAEKENNENSNSIATTNNKEALLRAVESIGTSNLGFVESMQICQYNLEVEDENDDLARELAFYNHSLEAVKLGYSQLAQAGIPTLRPSDYFCEQVKTDAHMAKIKDNLLLQEKKMEAFEQRNNRKLNKKFNKQVSAQKKAEKKQKIDNEISTLKQFRVGNKSKDNDSNRLESVLTQKNQTEKSSKRIAMDRKYGHGGSNKHTRKLTDQKSLNDFSKYDPKGGKSVRQAFSNKMGGRGGGRFGGRGGGRDRSSGREGGRGGGKGGNRPGKEARQQRRAKNSQSG